MCFISDQVSSHQREGKIWVCFGLSVHTSKTYPAFVTLKFRLSYSPYISSAKWHIRHATPPTSPINCCDVEFSPGPLLSSVHLLFWESGCRGGWRGGEVTRGFAFVQVCHTLCTLARYMYHVQQANRFWAFWAFTVKFWFQGDGDWLINYIWFLQNNFTCYLFFHFRCRT